MGSLEAKLLSARCCDRCEDLCHLTSREVNGHRSRNSLKMKATSPRGGGKAATSPLVRMSPGDSPVSLRTVASPSSHGQGAGESEPPRLEATAGAGARSSRTEAAAPEGIPVTQRGGGLGGSATWERQPPSVSLAPLCAPVTGGLSLSESSRGRTGDNQKKEPQGECGSVVRLERAGKDELGSKGKARSISPCQRSGFGTIGDYLEMGDGNTGAAAVAAANS